MRTGKTWSASSAFRPAPSRCSRIDSTTAAVPVMLWLLQVKQTTSWSGIWTVQIPEVSLTPVRLSRRM